MPGAEASGGGGAAGEGGGSREGGGDLAGGSHDQTGQGSGGRAFASLADAASAIVAASDPSEKAALTKAACEAWASRALSLHRVALDRPVPPRPGRPPSLQLVAPREVPRRPLGTREGRIAFCHAIAHIELNAVDLAWDIVARFAGERMPRSFFDDWVRVAFEEATHFGLLSQRLADHGAAFGDLPVHGGMWDAAEATADDLLARLAIVPLVLEARGLDVTPPMVLAFERQGDPATAAVLQKIYDEEKGHVYVGAAWFRYLCDRRGLRSEPTFHALVRRHFRGALRPPFNDRARSAACLTPGFYRPLEVIRT